ncbi:MAG: RNA-binding protein [Bacteroidia bacterium]|nr:RNA-binding protein [Bacteroidia bacterium]
MNIYVGNVNFKTSDESLKELFEEFGEVLSAKIIRDKYSGRSKGFGFVEMSNDEEAQEAINSLNGQEIDQKNIVVSEARPKVEGERKPRPFNKGGFRR